MSSQSPAKTTNNITNVAPTGTAVQAAPLNTSRSSVTLKNVGSVDVYLGSTNAVTTANGFLLKAGATLIDGDSDNAYFAITAGGTGDLRIMEITTL